jgi:sucrose phosphorylase
MLITYGDQLSEPGMAPLTSLAEFCMQQLAGLVSSIHILPFYPSTSDDGFSVSDYRLVDPSLGSWRDIELLRTNFRLMFDGVINHISAQSEWFRAFLRDEPFYRNYFIVVEDGIDLSLVVRPRTLPLLTHFGAKLVWTTFSADQVDLNYKEPRVLLEIIDLLLFYAAQGAEFIRLDAVAYLWKEIGTPCIHLPQTHLIIQLLRSIFDQAAPHVKLITETNVPHVDNISYFGRGADEAQLIYNFALPPLLLHTFYSSDAGALTKWATDLQLPSGRVTFLNFLASHDGIGINPVRGILTNEEIEAIVKRVCLHGGLVSSKQNPDGSKSPYELNINYFDALSDPHGNEPIEIQVDRFLAAHAIMFSMIGLPGIYFHSLFGSRGWPAGVQHTGANRTINRQKLNRFDLERDLADPSNLRHSVFTRISRFLRVRAESSAFDPYGYQKTYNFDASIFIVMRTSVRSNEKVLCIQNISPKAQNLSLDFANIFSLLPGDFSLVDILSGQSIAIEKTISLAPYQTCWLGAFRD